MHIFYHYTCRDNIAGIFQSGFISPGNATVNMKDIKSNYAVCLTSDECPKGHGLPDGREISREAAKRLKGVSQNGTKLFSLDFTKYRIKIAVPEDDENLVYVPTLLKDWPLLLQSLEAAGYFPCGELKSDADIAYVLYLLQSGELEGKAHTWWYYRGKIPLGWCVEVGVRMDENKYYSLPPAEFQELLSELSRK